MKLLSVNVGLPREIEWQGKRVRTSIFKSASAGHVRVMTLNAEGDEQSDLSVHGGVHKAVYAYPSEHYPFWREEVPGVDLPLGTFGENFTTEGLFEEAVHIGDRFRVGSAEFIVTQPRLPCFKLGIRFGRPEMVKRFLRSGRTGFYLAVLEEGLVTRWRLDRVACPGRARRYRGRYREFIHGGRDKPRPLAKGERITRASHRLARPLSQAPLEPGYLSFRNAGAPNIMATVIAVL